jgi:hypothetical protein
MLEAAGGKLKFEHMVITTGNFRIENLKDQPAIQVLQPSLLQLSVRTLSPHNLSQKPKDTIFIRPIDEHKSLYGLNACLRRSALEGLGMFSRT